jgi:hypothetical protein
MGFLEDFGKAVGDGFQATADAVGKFGNDAASAVDQATRNSIALAGSGVSAGGKVFGPLADMFGKDPAAFVLGLAKKTSSQSRTLLRRVASRTGKLSYTFPTPSGTRKVTATPDSKADANQIALTLALCALDSPATMQEEAGRMATGLPVKPRGLTGYTVYPLGLAGSPRGLFGIDDALILGIAVPILAAIAGTVLPTLISAASNVVQTVLGGGGPSAEEQAAAAKAKADAAKKKQMTTIAIVAAVVLLGGGVAYVSMRKK